MKKGQKQEDNHFFRRLAILAAIGAGVAYFSRTEAGQKGLHVIKDTVESKKHKLESLVQDLKDEIALIK